MPDDSHASCFKNFHVLLGFNFREIQKNSWANSRGFFKKWKNLESARIALMGNGWYRLCWAITGHNSNRGFSVRSRGFSVQSRGFSVQCRGFSVQIPQSKLRVVVEVVYSLSSVQMTISQQNCDA
jgi:hypothetical protein